MDPLTVDDLLHLIGQKEAQILQLTRELAKATSIPELTGEVVYADEKEN